MAPNSIPNDIYQHSLPKALSLGVTELSPQVNHLTSHGTHGIATTGDGSLVVLIDSVAWRISRTREYPMDTDDEPSSGDMRVRSAYPTTQLPFAMVTVFQPHSYSRSYNTMGAIRSMFESERDGLPNSFTPFRVTATFRNVKVRVQGEEFALHDVKGTIFGFWAPAWAANFSVDGLYAIFLGDVDESGKKKGGEVLDFEALDDEADLRWAICGRFHLGLPRGKKWEKLNLRD